MRHIARIIAIATLAIMLAGCTIVSKSPLLATSEIVTPLPDRLYLLPYDPDTLTLGNEEVRELVLDGDAYVAQDGFRLRFAGEADAEGRYVVEVAPITDAESEGYMYGLARFADGLLGVQILLPEDVETVLERHPELDLRVSRSEGVEVKSRSDLDALIAMARSGELKLLGLVYSASDTAGAVAPAELVRDGDWYGVKSAD